MAKTKILKRLTPKKLDALINEIFNAHCSGIQITLLDIPKVFRVGRETYEKVYGTYLKASTETTERGGWTIAEPDVMEASIREHLTNAITQVVQTIRQN